MCIRDRYNRKEDGSIELIKSVEVDEANPQVVEDKIKTLELDLVTMYKELEVLKAYQEKED